MTRKKGQMERGEGEGITDLDWITDEDKALIRSSEYVLGLKKDADVIAGQVDEIEIGKLESTQTQLEKRLDELIGSRRNLIASHETQIQRAKLDNRVDDILAFESEIIVCREEMKVLERALKLEQRIEQLRQRLMNANRKRTQELLNEAVLELEEKLQILREEFKIVV